MKVNRISTARQPDSVFLQCPTKSAHRILVVEDDKDIRRSSAQALMGSGYEVDAAEDGVTAWQALQDGSFNLLITDNKMPRLTGVELVRKLRSAHMALPVIMATRKLPAEALAQNPSLELAALLPMPFSIDELLETVRAVLRVADSAPGQLELLPDWQSQPLVTDLHL